MKNIIVLFLCLLLVQSCQKKDYTLDDLIEINGVYYNKDTNEPYTGRALSYLGNQVSAIHHYQQGEHLQATTFYPNGQKEYDIQFKDNKENGFWRHYFYSGQLNYEYYYVEGQRQGKARFYYENGQLQLESNYKDNQQLDVYVSYYQDGSLNSKGDSLGNEWTYYKTGQLHRYRQQSGKEIFYNKDGKEVPYEEVEEDYKAQYNP